MSNSNDLTASTLSKLEQAQRTARVAEREQQKRSTLLYNRPATISTAEYRTELEKLKKDIIKQERDYRDETVLLDSGERVSKAQYSLYTPEQQAKIKELGIAGFNDWAKSQNEMATEPIIIQPQGEDIDTILLSTGERVSLVAYNALPQDKQQQLNAFGISRFNALQEQERLRFLADNIKLDTGEYVDKDTFYSLTPEQQADLKTSGITAFQANQQLALRTKYVQLPSTGEYVDKEEYMKLLHSDSLLLDRLGTVEFNKQKKAEYDAAYQTFYNSLPEGDRNYIDSNGLDAYQEYKAGELAEQQAILDKLSPFITNNPDGTQSVDIFEAVQQTDITPDEFNQIGITNQQIAQAYYATPGFNTVPIETTATVIDGQVVYTVIPPKPEWITGGYTLTTPTVESVYPVEEYQSAGIIPEGAQNITASEGKITYTLPAEPQGARQGGYLIKPEMEELEPYVITRGVGGQAQYDIAQYLKDTMIPAGTISNPALAELANYKTNEGYDLTAFLKDNPGGYNKLKAAFGDSIEIQTNPVTGEIRVHSLKPLELSLEQIREGERGYMIGDTPIPNWRKALQPFFPELDLYTINIELRDDLGEMTQGKYLGGNKILISPNAALDLNIYAHELQHLLQFKKDKLQPIKYVLENITKGYPSNRYEDEAQKKAGEAMAALGLGTPLEVSPLEEGQIRWGLPFYTEETALGRVAKYPESRIFVKGDIFDKTINGFPKNDFTDAQTNNITAEFAKKYPKEDELVRAKFFADFVRDEFGGYPIISIWSYARDMYPDLLQEVADSLVMPVDDEAINQILRISTNDTTDGEMVINPESIEVLKNLGYPTPEMEELEPYVTDRTAGGGASYNITAYLTDKGITPETIKVLSDTGFSGQTIASAASTVIAQNKLKTYQGDLAQYIRDNPEATDLKIFQDAGIAAEVAGAALQQSKLAPNIDSYWNTRLPQLLEENGVSLNQYQYINELTASGKVIKTGTDEFELLMKVGNIHSQITQEYKDRYGEASLYGSVYAKPLSFIFPAARALAPDVELSDISGAEWAATVGSALMLAMPLGGAGIIGKALNIGASTAFVASTIMDWEDMTPNQRILAVAGDLAFIALPFVLSKMGGIVNEIKYANNPEARALIKEASEAGKAAKKVTTLQKIAKLEDVVADKALYSNILAGNLQTAEAQTNLATKRLVEKLSNLSKVDLQLLKKLEKLSGIKGLSKAIPTLGKISKELKTAQTAYEIAVGKVVNNPITAAEKQALRDAIRAKAARDITQVQFNEAMNKFASIYLEPRYNIATITQTNIDDILSSIASENQVIKGNRIMSQEIDRAAYQASLLGDTELARLTELGKKAPFDIPVGEAGGATGDKGITYVDIGSKTPKPDIVVITEGTTPPRLATKETPKIPTSAEQVGIMEKEALKASISYYQKSGVTPLGESLESMIRRLSRMEVTPLFVAGLSSITVLGILGELALNPSIVYGSASLTMGDLEELAKVAGLTSTEIEQCISSGTLPQAIIYQSVKSLPSIKAQVITQAVVNTYPEVIPLIQTIPQIKEWEQIDTQIQTKTSIEPLSDAQNNIETITQPITETLTTTDELTEAKIQTQPLTETQTQVKPDVASVVATAKSLLVNPPVIKPPPPYIKPPPLLPHSDGEETSDAEKREAFRGAVCWKQGIVWHAWKYPYEDDETDLATFYKEPPPGAVIIPGAKTAQETIQLYLGDTPPPPDRIINMGIMDINISTTPDGQLQIKYTEDAKQARGDKDSWFGDKEKKGAHTSRKKKDTGEVKSMAVANDDDFWSGSV